MAEFVFGTRGGAIVPRPMVVRGDIDPTSSVDVLWAMMTRCHPGAGEIDFPHLATNPRDAFLRSDEKAAMFTTKFGAELPAARGLDEEDGAGDGELRRALSCPRIARRRCGRYRDWCQPARRSRGEDGSPWTHALLGKVASQAAIEVDASGLLLTILSWFRVGRVRSMGSLPTRGRSHLA
ncbi:MAG: hypothetical protein U1E60_31895 [Reyranellaceae bacterium]